MSESKKPFVVTDRRKFTKEGELRPDGEQSGQATPPTPVAPPEQRRETVQDTQASHQIEEDSFAPTPEQTEQSRLAYQQTADRIDTAIRAADPGADHPPAMDFNQLVQSVYLTAIMQMGGATPEGEKPRVDILGARQSIDMLGVLGEKTTGNLSPEENKLLESALFELRIAFLEITQALARSASAKSGVSSKQGVVL